MDHCSESVATSTAIRSTDFQVAEHIFKLSFEEILPQRSASPPKRPGKIRNVFLVRTRNDPS